MNARNKRRQWIGVVGLSGLTIIFVAIVASIIGHMIVDGVSIVGIGEMIYFAAAAVLFGVPAVEKLQYLRSH